MLRASVVQAFIVALVITFVLLIVRQQVVVVLLVGFGIFVVGTIVNYGSRRFFWEKRDSSR